MRLKLSATVGSSAVVLDTNTGEVLRAALEGLTAGATMFPKVLYPRLQCNCRKAVIFLYMRGLRVECGKCVKTMFLMRKKS